MPWMFLLNVVLACLPMIDARVHHGTTIAIIVYCIGLFVFWKLDNWASEKNWGLATKLGLKLPALAIIWAAVLTSAMEKCDRSGLNCQRLFF